MCCRQATTSCSSAIQPRPRKPRSAGAGRIRPRRGPARRSRQRRSPAIRTSSKSARGSPSSSWRPRFGSRSDVQLLDVRDSAEVGAGVLPGSRHVPLTALTESLDDARPRRPGGRVLRQRVSLVDRRQRHPVRQVSATCPSFSADTAPGPPAFGVSVAVRDEFDLKIRALPRGTILESRVPRSRRGTTERSRCDDGRPRGQWNDAHADVQHQAIRPVDVRRRQPRARPSARIPRSPSRSADRRPRRRIRRGVHLRQRRRRLRTIARLGELGVW